MGILSADTSREIEKIQFQILRSKGVPGRLSLLADSVLTSWALVLAGAGRARDRWLGFKSPVEYEEARTEMEPLKTPLLLAQIFDELGVEYVIGGSYASSIHGEPRSTRDCDFLVALASDQLDSFEQKTNGLFYMSRVAAEEAIELNRCFNLIHLETGFKLDIFISEGRDFDRERLKRGQSVAVDGQSLRFSSAEDTILSKLEWYKQYPSEQQWRDILGIFLLQEDKLDLGYLKYWSRELGVSKKLAQAEKALEDL